MLRSDYSILRASIATGWRTLRRNWAKTGSPPSPAGLKGRPRRIGDDGELLVYQYDFVRWMQGQPENGLTWD